jgi:hypothetical protein
MVLATLLERNRDTILGRWFDLIAKTYPPVTSEFLAKNQDQFQNPVGYTIEQSIGAIYDQLVSTMDADELLRALDGIIRIRSVQDFNPSEAVAFIFQLKGAIREVLEAELRGATTGDGLSDLDARIDRVALLAFDKYTECREKIHEVRNREIKDRTNRLLERVNLGSSMSRQKGELIDDKE